MSSRLLGLGLAILGVLLLSPDAALTRLFDGASWTLIFWRTLGTFVVLGAYPSFGTAVDYSLIFVV